MFKALIIEDERPAWIAIAKLGNWAKYHLEPPLRAANGLEALDILEKETVHLILMDVMMPRLDGFSAIMRIRQKRNLPTSIS